MRAWALVILVAWPLAAFGGRGPVTAAAFSAACIFLALLTRPRAWRDKRTRLLDLGLGALAAVTLLQLVPLPTFLLDLLSPHARDLRGALALGRPVPPGWLPITIALNDSAWGIIVTLGAVAMFLLARESFARDGVRRTVRGISGVSFAIAAIAIAQAATAGRMIYWRFPTEYEGPLPFGPFVNRNHFATWAIMALPLLLGYIAARASRRAPRGEHLERHPRARLAHVADGRMLWLSVSAGILLAALLLCASRSGIAALAVAGIATVAATRHRRRHSGGLIAALALMAIFATARGDLPALAGRFANTRADIQGRLMIWRDTAPVVRDFRLTGTGSGTFKRVMLVYQRSYRDVQFNQAHNHYLQAAAEGGLLVVVPVVIGIWGLARAGVTRLANEPAGAFWLRAGAGCGLLAVGLQSVWEAGLVMPANAALAAVLAAVLVHQHHGASGVP